MFQRTLAGTLVHLCAAAYKPTQKEFLLKAVRHVDEPWLFCCAFEEAGVLGYYIKTEGPAYLIFQGTNEFRDITRDVRALRAESWDALMLYNTHRGYRVPGVHRGFQGAWDLLRVDVLDCLTNMHPPNGPLYITGHSLGGALATLAAVALFGVGIEATVYTFACPRVGDRYFKRLLNRGLNLELHRVELQGDIIPRLPPWFMGYRHAGDRHFLMRDGTFCRPSFFSSLADGLRAIVRWFNVTAHEINHYACAVQRPTRYRPRHPRNPKRDGGGSAPAEPAKP